MDLEREQEQEWEQELEQEQKWEQEREWERELEQEQKWEQNQLVPPLHSVAECDVEDCMDCWEFWRDEMVDSREGEE